MRLFENQLEKRIKVLKHIVTEKEKALMNVPEGSIHVFSSDRRTQFYLNQDGKRKYMRENEKDTVRKLCQKDYDQKVLKSAKSELKELEKLYLGYQKRTFESVYEKLNKERKNMIQSVWLPDDEYIKKWEEKEYLKKTFTEDAAEYYTDKGERVRSKTEILIANALNRNGVPYRYEYPIYLNGKGTIHPDFTVLNVKDRKEMYWEHMGMMDDCDYAEEALLRIEAYEKNDIFPGDKLILTHETLRHPVNSKMIEKIIMKYLK